MIPPRATLLETVRGLLERTYASAPPLGDLAPFVIGDRGLRELYGSVGRAIAVGAAAGSAKTLVRETGDGLRVCIYYPDALIARLEEHPPWRGLGEENVAAFATLVEELDHLLCIAQRAADRRTCSLFELELHANVSKYLVLDRFLSKGAAMRPPRGRERVWLRWQLFHRGTWSDPDPRVRERYREASRWALRYLDALERVPGRDVRLRSLRRFHGVGAAAKIDLIRELAAA